MNKYAGRILIVLTSVIVASLVVAFGKYQLGPDLTGGTILVYRVKDVENADLEQLTPTLKNRLDGSGLKNYVIRPLGADRVEIVMPKADLADILEIKRRVSTVGQLEFHVVADRRKNKQLVSEDGEHWWEQKKLAFEGGVFVPYGSWIPVPRDADYVDKSLIEQAEKSDSIKINDSYWFRPVDSVLRGDVNSQKNVVRILGGRRMVLTRWTNDELTFDANANLLKQGDDGERYILMVDQPPEEKVTGEFLSQTSKTLDDNSSLALSFEFNGSGARRFGDLTTRYRPDGEYRYRLGVVLDGRLRSAPTINEPITGGRGIISGSFDEKELDALEQVFKSGRLPYSLEKEPIQERTVGSSLGEDTQKSGIAAIIGAFLAVIAFTLFYYRFGGMIAIIALFLNLLFTVALMTLLHATWTLPGLAGLVLTIGMAIDSNVLIFERLREEQDLGKPFGLAIKSAYDKAWGTIFDSNVTTIITALILFAIGTDQIKGFAITLILGLLTSMFSAVFVTRLIFDVLYEKRWLKRLSMARILTNSNIDFLAAGRVCAILSVLLIGTGIAAVVMRGTNMLDIDFTGGTASGIQLTEPMEIAEVRERASKELTRPRVEEIQIEGEKKETRYLIRTDERDEETTPADKTVKAKLSRAFDGKLVVTSFQSSERTPIAEGETDESLKPFVGGKRFAMTVSPPVTLDVARNIVREAIDAILPGEADVDSKFTVISTDASVAENQPLSTITVATTLDADKLAETLTSQSTGMPLFDPYDQFGGQVAGETRNLALVAITLSWLSIIIYVWARFGSWTFGIAGVVALIHDVLVAVGLLAIFSLIAVHVPGAEKLLITEMQISLDIVAALLTLIGYSINDTIVIFDRIREYKRNSTRVTRDVVHRALNSTLSRTIITSLLTFLVVIVLFIFGGEGLHGFAFVLVVGIISGTYSTIYIACPIVVALEKWREKRSAASVPFQASRAETVSTT